MEWANDDLENIENEERNEREMLRVSNLMLSTALQQRDKMEKTTLIELKHQKVQYKAIQKAIKKLLAGNRSKLRSLISLQLTYRLRSSTRLYKILNHW